MRKGAGFMTGRGCNDQILTVKQIVEKTIKKDSVVYMACICGFKERIIFIRPRYRK